MNKIEIEIDADCVRVKSPYNRRFIRRAKHFSGRWEDSRWVFPAGAEPQVRELCLDCFGDEGYGVSDLVNVRLEAETEIAVCRCPITIGGRVLVRARDRDSGAAPGEDVLFFSGTIASGGSMKYWKTIVEEGTELKVLNVPRSLLETYRIDADDMGFAFSVEEIETTDSASLLQKEKERLLGRLMEVEEAMEEAEDNT